MKHWSLLLRPGGAETGKCHYMGITVRGTGRNSSSSRKGGWGGGEDDLFMGSQMGSCRR